MTQSIKQTARTCQAARGVPPARVLSSAVTARENVSMSFLMALWLTAQPAACA